MIQLPTPDDLAVLVSNVTKIMFGISFTRVDGRPDSAKLWRMAVLPINGARPLMVAIASDQLSGSALGGRMFQVPLSKVDPTMVEDTLCELVNITAGRLKQMISLDQALGLPKIIRENAPIWSDTKEARQAILRGNDVELFCQISMS